MKTTSVYFTVYDDFRVVVRLVSKLFLVLSKKKIPHFFMRPNTKIYGFQKRAHKEKCVKYSTPVIQ